METRRKKTTLALVILVPLGAGVALFGLALYRGNDWSKGDNGRRRSLSPADRPVVDNVEAPPRNVKQPFTESKKNSDGNDPAPKKPDEEVLLSPGNTKTRGDSAQRVFLQFAETKDLHYLEVLKTAARTEQDAEVRIGLFSYLRETSDEEAIGLLSDALSDPDPQIRRVAARALGFMGTEKYANAAWILTPDGISKKALEPKIDACRRIALNGASSALGKEGDVQVKQILEDAIRKLSDALAPIEGDK